VELVMPTDMFNDVLDQIKTDIASGDLTALAELLSFVPRENVIAYMSEDN